MNETNAMNKLKEWCESFLSPKNYYILGESESYNQTIYINSDNDEALYVAFDQEGSVIGTGTVTIDEIVDHIRDIEG